MIISKIAMRSEIQIKLVFSNLPMSPDDLSQKLGINATRSWNEGDEGVIKTIRKKTNGWKLNSGLDTVVHPIFWTQKS